MADITLRQLEHFRAIAEHDSLREAAAALHVSDSAIASALDQLERSTGLQLCVRRKAKGITLTADGRRVADLATELLDHASRFRDAVADLAGEIAGPVSVGCSPGLAPTVVPPLLDRVRERHPRIELEIVTAASSELVARVRRGQLDLVITSSAPTAEDGLDSAVLFHRTVHAILPADHPLAAADPVPLVALAVLPLVLLDVEESAARVVSLFEPLGLTPVIGSRTGSFELIRSLVARGFGYSLQLQRPWGDRTYEGLPLAVRSIEPAPSPDAVRMVWPDRVVLTTRARAVVDTAVAALEAD